MRYIQEELVGTWKLIAASSVTRDGDRNEAVYGVGPTGILIYTRDGRVTSLISYGGRKPLSMNAGPEQQAEAFNSFLAYTGSYSVTDDDKVTHHIDISSVENYVAKDLVRTIKLEGSRLTLITPPMMVNKKFQSIELTWERIPDDAATAPPNNSERLQHLKSDDRS